VIPTTLHGAIDYLVAIFLISAPYTLGFADGGAAQWSTIGLGAFVLVYSLFTDYELGMVRVLRFRIHLVLDVVFALLLLASPWVLGFSTLIWWPHVLVGIMGLVVTAFSARRTDRFSHTAGGSNPNLGGRRVK
jgi:hypothetical protein